MLIRAKERLSMLRITIDLCPGGDLDSAKTIATGIVGRAHEPDQPALVTFRLTTPVAAVELLS